MTKEKDTFTCYTCGGVFLVEWSDEEAQEELERNFGGDTKPENCEVVCDDCYEAIMDGTPI